MGSFYPQNVVINMEIISKKQTYNIRDTANQSPNSRMLISSSLTLLHSTPGGLLPYRYVRPQRVGFFSRFGHKQGIDFGHFPAILVINRVSIFLYLY